jgi:general nucleoside transport system ATP-binding protein
VEILKALYRQADILILDEPTGVLTPAEADHLFRILKGLRDQGKTIILITHKLREIMAITDNVSVMRRGEMVATCDRRDQPRGAGRADGRPQGAAAGGEGPAHPGAPVLEVRDLRVRDAKGVERLKGVSFTCARARSSASPGWRATGSRNCWRCWAASEGDRRGAAERPAARPVGGRGPMGGRGRDGHRPCARGPAAAWA